MPCHLWVVMVLLLPCWFVCPLFLFLVWLLWPGIPMLCWVQVERVGILALFLVLGEGLSALHHWVWCWLWVSHRWVCCVEMCSLCTTFDGGASGVNGHWILWSAFSVSMIMNWSCDFYPSFVGILHYIDWFVYVGPPLYSWNWPYLSMVY